MDNLYAELVSTEPTVEFELRHCIENPVKVMRIEAGLTQKELSNLLNCSQANISQIEKLKEVRVETLNRVEAAISDF